MDITLKHGRSNEALAALLPFPAADANKYTRGHLNLVAGSAAYPGAACLAAAGATRAGAGYTEVFCAGKSMITVRAWMPSRVVRDWR
ncbi:NAD(P)H-hydrate dehydratase, partial [Adlercreutzia equolifaciens]|uniref:NAD(P)H-hydrate dehydratase n=1 Tax=Adlercreutzia equolifaciens TaxID=446660 RepID=UPI0023AFE74D